MKHFGPYIISRLRDGTTELVNRLTGELKIVNDDWIKNCPYPPPTDNNLLTIPGTSSLSDRLADPNWLADLRTRRLDYVRTKAKTSRKRRQHQLPEMEEGEGGVTSPTRKRKRATSKGASKRTQSSLQSRAGTDPIALQLAKLLGGIK